jgi:hypothetical protein
MNRTITLALASALGAAALGLYLQPAPEAAAPKGTITRPTSVTAEAQTAAGRAILGSSAENSRTLHSSPGITRTAYWHTGASDFIIEDEEAIASTSSLPSEFRSWVLSTPFVVKGVSSRALDELCVFGQARNGDDVIELWTLNPEIGAPTAARSVSSSSIGVGSPSTTTTTGISGGGTYAPPSSRPQNATVSKVEIFRGNLGGVLHVENEIDGRYIMALTATVPRLRQLVPASPHYVGLSTWEVADVPNIADATHLVSGRMSGDTCMIVFSPNNGVHYERTYMWDTANDGVFEVFDTFDAWTQADIYQGLLTELTFNPE